MKKKYLFIITTIISVAILMYVGIGVTYSKFTATADTVLQAEVTAKLDYILYFQAPPDWLDKNGNGVYIYMYNSDGTVENATFPGDSMTLFDSEKNIYKYNLSASKAQDTDGNYILIKAIFSNNSNSRNTSRKTVNLSVTANDNGKIFVPELYKNAGNNNEIRMYSYAFNDGACNCYYWGSASGPSWPGSSCGSAISDKGHTYKLDRSVYPNVIFNGTVTSGRSTATWKTDDLKVPLYQDLTCKMNGYKDSLWERFFYNGSWHSYSNWIDTEYSTWYSGDYQTFNSTRNLSYETGT